jgi:hypothetical protein
MNDRQYSRQNDRKKKKNGQNNDVQNATQKNKD